MSYPTASDKMSPIERQAVLSLSAVMSLRMLGLFMILPLFALYAHQLPYATPMLVGIAMGIYGLTQATLQIPFGMLSDHIGRRKVIATGLFIFAIGSIIAATSDTIFGVIIGRALQGAGAVGSTIIAMVADLTREDQRTKAMAVTGITIGLSFSLAMVLGPILVAWMQISQLFWLAAFFGVSAIFILFTWVPLSPAQLKPEPGQFFMLLKNGDLLRLNLGIFILHAVFTASFVVIPLGLQNLAGLSGAHQWQLYLPVLTLAFACVFPLILIAEKKHQMKNFFLGSIVVLILAELLLWQFSYSLWLTSCSLFLFLTAFSLLEAFLPSLVSKIAPPTHKGTAMGVYSSTQFLGIFIGGSFGGVLYGKLGLTNVYLFCVLLCIAWLIITFKMKKF